MNAPEVVRLERKQRQEDGALQCLSDPLRAGARMAGGGRARTQWKLVPPMRIAAAQRVDAVAGWSGAAAGGRRRARRSMPGRCLSGRARTLSLGMRAGPPLGRHRATGAGGSLVPPVRGATRWREIPRAGRAGPVAGDGRDAWRCVSGGAVSWRRPETPLPLHAGARMEAGAARARAWHGDSQ